MAHRQLIESLTTYYNTLAALRYIKTSDIIHPPHNGHTNVDKEAAHEQGFGDDMISIMQSLPYLSVDCEDTPFLPGSTKPRSYLDDDFLDWARDPVFSGLHTIKATHLVLTNPGKAGVVLIYDTENNKLISWSPSKSNAKHAADGHAYAHLLAYAPEELLGEWTRNWISLTWLPYRDGTGWGFLIEQPSVPELEQASKKAGLREQYQIKLVQRGLKEVYIASGWDVDAENLEDARRSFDGEAFERKSQEWKKSTQALLDQAYGEKWTWSMIGERLGLEQASASILDPVPVPGSDDLAQSRRMGSGLEPGRPCAHLKL